MKFGLLVDKIYFHQNIYQGSLFKVSHKHIYQNRSHLGDSINEDIMGV